MAIRQKCGVLKKFSSEYEVCTKKGGHTWHKTSRFLMTFQSDFIKQTCEPVHDFIIADKMFKFAS